MRGSRALYIKRGEANAAPGTRVSQNKKPGGVVYSPGYAAYPAAMSRDEVLLLLLDGYTLRCFGHCLMGFGNGDGEHTVGLPRLDFLFVDVLGQNERLLEL